MVKYELVLALAGLAILSAVVFPRVLSDYPLSSPLLYLSFGAVVFASPLDLPTAHPALHPTFTEKLAELVVIVALTSAGLKLDRPPSVSGWSVVWRLLGVTMPLTILAVTALGLAAGLATSAAVLLGAVLAPTDPVLASDVQVGSPMEGRDEGDEPSEHEDEVRFGLTGEAALNDGLAFPFTYAAIWIAVEGATWTWVPGWALFDVGYRIAVGLVLGVVVGRAFARVVFHFPATTTLARAMEGAEALAVTLLAYGVTELVEGYGFIAVFVAALTLRYYERTHDYHQELHDVAELSERLLTAALLVLVGGALVDGVLDPLGPTTVVLAVLVVLVVRPLAGFVGLLGFDRQWEERAVVAFFGIRGVGSIYYLAYALNQASFADASLLWAIVGLVILLSTVVHGVTVSPVLSWLERRRTVE